MDLWKRGWHLRGTSLSVLVLLLVFYLHFTGLYIFSQGFLLTRIALSDINHCNGDSCTLPATHQRLVLLVIDALRFDFVAPNPPVPSSPFYHNVLTLPRELTEKYPDRCFLFNSYSDPPTSTLQRIKGITTGSLPTFVDAGSSFSGLAIEEDSLISQLVNSGKRTAFMGDDTWMTTFPDLFTVNMSHPYDSFNVEDLHTVDNGVVRHLFPLLEESKSSRSWDAIFGHFLGVDHVGHRVGPDHPTMKTKLQQMDDVLRRVVDLLSDDTLLVVLGDHGMDRKGDHGGDDIFETSAAMWIYSKVPLQASKDIPDVVLPTTKYPETDVPVRWIQQIDLVPTVSLLLGLPIPFNNLGSIIPEVFSRENYLESAIKINAEQIHRYLTAYRASGSSGELDSLWPTLSTKWENASYGNSISAFYEYNRLALEVCRSLWAQFNVSRMSLGLVLLALSAATVSILYVRMRHVTDWESWASKRIGKVLRVAVVSTIVTPIVYYLTNFVIEEISFPDIFLASPSIAICVLLLLDFLPSINISFWTSLQSISILILHASLFFSNSFTFWEDRIMPFFLLSILVPSLRVGLTTPNYRFRFRILMFSGIYAVCVRLMGMSSVCREEQQPYCYVTFYSSSSQTAPPSYALFLGPLFSIALPYALQRILAISKSDVGIAPMFLKYVLRSALVAGSVNWVLEWAEMVDFLGLEYGPTLRTLRTVVACTTFVGLIVGTLVWWLRPLTVDLRASKPKSDTPGSVAKTMVVINSNVYGAPYLLFWTMALGFVYLASQLVGQITLALGTIALISHLEISDSVRDSYGLEAAFNNAASLSAALDNAKGPIPDVSFTFSQIIPVALLGLHAFFSSGHQATLASLQWKTAFLLWPTLAYPAAHIGVFLNTLGPIVLFALAAPLVALWQYTPSPDSRKRALGEATRAAVGVMLYYGVLLLCAAASAALLRRHLMVWKVFAPRFMLAALCTVAVDVALILGVGLGVGRSSFVTGNLIDRTQKNS